MTNGTITGVGAGATVGQMFLCCVSVHHEGENLTNTFQVEENATRITVELAWDDPSFDLDLLVAGPDYEFFLPPEIDWSGPNLRDYRGFSVYAGNGTIGQPDGRVLTEITAPEALNLTGEWWWEVRSKSALEVPFTVTTIVEYEA